MQADDQLGSHSILEAIIDHKMDEHAVPKCIGWYNIPNSTGRKRVITTRGWYFHVQWRDGMRTWIPLLTLKASNQVELAEYCKIRKIDDHVAMAWWVD